MNLSRVVRNIKHFDLIEHIFSEAVLIIVAVMLLAASPQSKDTKKNDDVFLSAIAFKTVAGARLIDAKPVPFYAMSGRGDTLWSVVEMPGDISGVRTMFSNGKVATNVYELVVTRFDSLVYKAAMADTARDIAAASYARRDKGKLVSIIDFVGKTEKAQMIGTSDVVGMKLEAGVYGLMVTRRLDVLSDARGPSAFLGLSFEKAKKKGGKK